MNYFVVDGKVYDVLVTSLEENFNILYSENTGRTLDRGAPMVLDPLGTFFGHKVSVRRKQGFEEKFDELCDYISTPRYVGMDFEIAHNQSTIKYKAYVSNGTRKLVRIDAKTGKVYWDEISLNIVPISAQILPEGETNGDNSASIYHAASVDELPSDAADGSLAIVDSNSIIGTWKFNEVLNFDALHLSGHYGGHAVRIIAYDTTGAFDVFGSISFRDYPNSPITMDFGGTLAYDVQSGGWDDTCGAIAIYTNPIFISSDAFTESDFIAWLNQNATRISGGHSLYSRENGEWVYKCEIA